MSSKAYGQELILSFHEVPAEFFDVEKIEKTAKGLVDEIGMTKGPIMCWPNSDKTQDTGVPRKSGGISCIQFLEESSCTLHCLNEIQCVYLNLFSCKAFNSTKAKNYAQKHIGGKLVQERVLVRP